MNNISKQVKCSKTFHMHCRAPQFGKRKGTLCLKLTSVPANENNKYGSTSSFGSPPNNDFLICSPMAVSTASNKSQSQLQ